MQTRVLFYKARGQWQDVAVRALTGADYSHCELIAPWSEGPLYSTIGASKRDGSKVRRAYIDTRSGHWDVITFPCDPEAAWGRALPLLGKPYDQFGAVLSATAFARQRPGKWFCSELVAHALGYREPWEFSPGMLAASGQSKQVIYAS